MPSKLALVAVTTPHDGPWIRTDGTEQFVEVIGSRGDVWLEGSTKLLKEFSMQLEPSVTATFPSDIARYRVVRRDAGLPVTVRVHFR